MIFQIERVPSPLKPKTDILALGADTRQRISWSQAGKIFSLWPKKDFVDIADFYFQGSEFLSKRHACKPKVLTFDPHHFFVCNQKSAAIKEKYFREARLFPVFHHVAHIDNFGFENGSSKKFIGIAFDGTGFGPDRRIWGGEFFVFENRSFRRVAHLEYQPLPGNEAAILEPWRSAFAILYRTYSKKIFKLDLPFLRGIPGEKLRLLREMADKDFNSPQTSSAGRLFDAASALLDLKTAVKKEAEAAVALEKAASLFKSETDRYAADFKKEDGLIVIATTPLFRQIVDDLRRGTSVPEIAYKFHLTLAGIIGQTCGILRKKYRLDDVYLCGGVFMNDVLTREASKILVQDGFRATFAPRPATTDFGISQGQIAACVMTGFR